MVGSSVEVRVHDFGNLGCAALRDERVDQPVGPAVGDVRNDGPALIEALPAVEPVDLTLF